MKLLKTSSDLLLVLASIALSDFFDLVFEIRVLWLGWDILGLCFFLFLSLLLVPQFFHQFLLLEVVKCLGQGPSSESLDDLVLLVFFFLLPFFNFFLVLPVFLQDLLNLLSLLFLQRV